MKRAITLLSFVAIAACSSGTPATFVPASTSNAVSAPDTTGNGTGNLIVRVTLRTPKLTPDYVSVATRGMTVSVIGLMNLKKTVGLTVNAAGCRSKNMTRECMLEIPSLKACKSKKNCYSATVETYDAYDAKTHTIPPGAHVLSAAQSVGFHIGKKTTVIPIVLEGVPASVAFVPDPSSSLDLGPSGYVLPKCSGASQKVDVFGVDADDNYILGAGAPTVSLTSDDAAQLNVVNPSKDSNTFLLQPPVSPAYPYGNHTIHLTASATPGQRSGGAAQSAQISVTYSGDICGVFTNFPIPTASSEPSGIAVGADQNLWFTELRGNKVGRITTAGVMTEFTLPTGFTGPAPMTLGPDGNVWFALSSFYIANVTTTGTVGTPHPISGGTILGLVTGPDGNIWYTQFSDVGKMTTTGVFNSYPITTIGAAETIVVGPDKNLWFNEFNPPRQIGTVTTAGVVTQYPIPVGVAPTGIAVGPDGALWFPTYLSLVEKISTAGVFSSTFSAPGSGSVQNAIVTGPDDALWVSNEFNSFQRVTTSGAVTSISMPSGFQPPSNMVVGPDGAIWFTEFFYAGQGQIARLY
jgi:virginiamycin B lyase